ncbi:MAG TPA: HNH endonuclease signature motif containing protein, partial [Nocardioidaceae bacterium]|nr:HNH endonuclease signature motif containing protein [Nocardioidaceae bacterium]
PDSLFTLFDQVDNARGTDPEPQAEPQPDPRPDPQSEPDSENAAEEPDAADDEQTEKSETPESEQTEESGTGERSAEKADPQAGGRPVPATFRRPTQLPATMLYIHFDRTWGTYSLDGLGAITRSEAAEILGHSKVTVRPVIDLESTITATGYVASPRLKEQTALFNGSLCTFPSCDRPARVCDYDHITNFRDSGATDSRNGHRLCRYHHRAKTFTDWDVQSPAPGVWVWTSPTGRTYLVTGGTTTRLPGRVETARNRRKPDAA